jgi:hypothetical protein
MVNDCLGIALGADFCFRADSCPYTRILLLVFDFEGNTSTAIVIPVSCPKGYGADSTRNTIGVFSTKLEIRFYIVVMWKPNRTTNISSFFVGVDDTSQGSPLSRVERMGLLAVSVTAIGKGIKAFCDLTKRTASYTDYNKDNKPLQRLGGGGDFIRIKKEKKL